MDFGKDNLRLRMQAVNQLRMGVGESVAFVEAYAKICNLDVVKCLIVLFKNRRARRRREKMKAVLKRVLGIQH
jgi:hypothetical protein